MNRKPIIRPYMSHPPECREYDPAAVDVARLVAQRILTHLPMVAVEHVGSTAVPDCCGKGIVDLVVVYPEGRLELTRTILDNLGFQPQKSGHRFPETRPMRVGAVEFNGRTYRLHVHVIAENSPEVRQLCRFRDQLRADAALRAAYVGQKREIVAAGVQDPETYTRFKSGFIQRVLKEGGREPSSSTSHRPANDVRDGDDTQQPVLDHRRLPDVGVRE